VVTYVPYDPSFAPMRVALTDADRDSIRTRVKPSLVQLAVSKPAQSLLERQLERSSIRAASSVSSPRSLELVAIP
jgi:hypothetical protein